MYFMETIVENKNWHAFKIDPREKLWPQYQNYLTCWIHANQGSADYDQGMGNRGEVFMTWEGFEPGTWSLELWDPKRFELGTL